MNPEDEAEEDGANIDLDSQRKGKCVVLKTSTRQVIQFLFILYIYNSLLRTHFTIMVEYCIIILYKIYIVYILFHLGINCTFLWVCYVFCGVFMISVIYISWVANLVLFIMWQTIFLPVVGLVDPDKLKPGDLVGVNKDSYLILDTLPSEYDSRVKAMEVDEKPTEDYNDIGGLEKQVKESYQSTFLL